MTKQFICCLILSLVLLGCQREDQEDTPPPPAVMEQPLATETAATSTPPATPMPLATANLGPTPTAPLTEPEATATALPTEVPPAEPLTSIQLVPVASGFFRPTYLTHAFDQRLFVLEQPGRVRIITDGQVLEPPFLSIEQRVGTWANEQGLLSVAFHPRYEENGFFYVNYTNLNGDTVVARYQVSPEDPDRADVDSEMILLTIGQPYGNHNGGQLKFGPDGYLYIGMGDGGSAGDPLNHGQNPATLLGALLRIDVDQVGGVNDYGIPADNPFVADSDKRDEIWAYGLRNPWRFSFDRLTGDLYTADVGQNAWEEVNFQPADSPGGENYGWNIMEGAHCFRRNNCDMTGVVLPVVEYGRAGGCSISGGYVYRGSQFPALYGNYFYADYCSGFIWSLRRQADGTWLETRVAESRQSISSFGEDAAGELYILGHASGQVLQIQP